MQVKIFSILKKITSNQKMHFYVNQMISSKLYAIKINHNYFF